MYTDVANEGQDKGFGIIEHQTEEHLKKRNISATRDPEYPNLSLIVAYKGIVQMGTQPGMDDTIKE